MKYIHFPPIFTFVIICPDEQLMYMRAPNRKIKKVNRQIKVQGHVEEEEGCGIQKGLQQSDQ